MRATPLQPSSIAVAADAFCHPWTPLILREVMLGRRRFNEIKDELAIATNSLASRLRLLVAEGILEPVAYSDRPPRAEYHLTDKGRELVPVLVLLQRWGERHGGDLAHRPLRFTHRCGEPLNPQIHCKACGEVVRWADLAAAPLQTPA
jgi:DNA-binding HxlR family transcriptional regulator